MSKFAYLVLCSLVCLGLGCDDDDPAAANEDNTGDLPTTVNPPLAPIDNTDDAMAATSGGRADMPMTVATAASGGVAGMDVVRDESDFTPDITIPDADNGGGAQGGHETNSTIGQGQAGESTAAGEQSTPMQCNGNSDCDANQRCSENVCVADESGGVSSGGNDEAAAIANSDIDATTGGMRAASSRDYLAECLETFDCATAPVDGNIYCNSCFGSQNRSACEPNSGRCVECTVSPQCGLYGLRNHQCVDNVCVMPGDAQVGGNNCSFCCATDVDCGDGLTCVDGFCALPTTPDDGTPLDPPNNEGVPSTDGAEGFYLDVCAENYDCNAAPVGDNEYCNWCFGDENRSVCHGSTGRCVQCTADIECQILYGLPGHECRDRQCRMP